MNLNQFTIKAQEIITTYRDSPWALDVWPVWFTALLVSTVSFAILSAALIFWLIKRRHIMKEH